MPLNYFAAHTAALQRKREKKGAQQSLPLSAAKGSDSKRTAMDFEQIVQLEKQTLIPTYDRLPILAVRGEGCVLYDDRGRGYADFLGGLAVNALGYAHPELLAVLRDP